MVYTIKIDDTTAQGQSILNMLLALAVDYSFLQITEDMETEKVAMQCIQTDQDAELDAELDRRFGFVLQNPEQGKTWEEIEKKLLAQ